MKQQSQQKSLNLKGEIGSSSYRYFTMVLDIHESQVLNGWTCLRCFVFDSSKGCYFGIIFGLVYRTAFL